LTDKTKPSQNFNEPEDKPADIQEYLYANLLFWGLLVVAAVFAFFICGAVWDDIMSGTLEFLFVILGGGFTLGSVLDYFYEENFSKSAPGGK